jgi:hypothetical protein
MGKGKVSARLPSYYATLLSYCSRGGDGAEGGFANARSGERLLLPATLSSRISPTVHAQVARMCAPLIRARVYRSGSGARRYLRRARTMESVVLVEGRAPRSSSRRGKS